MRDSIDRALQAASVVALLLAIASLFAVLFNLWLGAKGIGQIAVLVAFVAWTALKLRRLRSGAPAKGEQETSED